MNLDRLRRRLRWVLSVAFMTPAFHGAGAQGASPWPAAWTQLRNGSDNSGNLPGRGRSSWSITDTQVVRGLAVVGRAIYIGSAPLASERPVVPAADTLGSLSARDLSNGRLLWSVTLPSWVHGDPVVYGNRVVVTFGRIPVVAIGGVLCVDARTGITLWRYLTAGGVMPSAAIDTVKKTVTIAGADGVIHVLSLVDGQVLHAWSLMSSVAMSSPRLDEAANVIVGSTWNLTSYASRSGELNWRTHVPFGGLLDIPVARGGGVLFTTGVEDLGLSAGWHGLAFREFVHLARVSAKAHPIARGQVWFRRQWLLAFDEVTGRTLWKQSLGIGLPVARNQSGTPVYAGGTVFVSSPVSQTAFAFDARSGTPEWSRPLASPHKGSPTIVGQDVLMGDQSGLLSIYNRATGVLVGQCRATGSFGVFSPVLVGETLFYATQSGTLVAQPYDSLRARMRLTGITECAASDVH